MKDDSTIPLSELRRQSPVAILLNVYKFLRRFISTAWFLVVYVWVGRNRDDGFATFEGMMSILALAASFGILLMSILSFLRYYYAIEERSVRIQQGVLFRKNTDLPFERIQNVNFEQNIIHQLFAVVRLQLDTAGSAGNEIKIDALPRREAEAIRDYILQQKREMQQEATEEQMAEEAPSALQTSKAPDEELLHLGLWDLVKIGASQNHIRTALLILGLGYSFMDDIQGVFRVDVLDEASHYAGDWVKSTLGLLLFLLLVAFMATMVRTVLQYFDLRFYKSHEGFRVTAGLFNKQETALRREKVQIIKWSDNPIRRLLGIFTLDIKQAVPVVVAQGKQKAEIPGCYPHQVEEVLRSCFPGFHEETVTGHRIHPAFAIRRFIYIGLLPTLAWIAFYYATQATGFLVASIAYPLLVAGLLYLYYWKFRLYVGHRYIRIKSGLLGTSHTVTPHYKIQAVQIIQTLYQHRKGLANLHIHTANGTLSIPYLNLILAQNLRDYILYQVESSKEGWM